MKLSKVVGKDPEVFFGGGWKKGEKMWRKGSYKGTYVSECHSGG